MSTKSNPILEIEGIGVQFGGLTALSEMTFTVHEGEIVALIGPNGAGKTTAFNVVTGFQRPTSGKVRYRSKTLNDLKPYEIADLGLVRTFQRTSVFKETTVFNNVLTGLHRNGRSNLWDSLLRTPREIRSEKALLEDAHEIISFVGLERQKNEIAGALSYGEQRLVGVALALAVKPSMLLLDEPVSGMNSTETNRFVELMKKVRATGITILLVEHDMAMVMGVSDRIIVLNYGRIIAEGLPEVIQKDPEVIRAYLGQGKKKRA